MLSAIAVPKYYGRFRESVIRGDIPVCENIALEMDRIDEMIKHPGIYYDPNPVEKWIRFCENEMTLTDGSPLHLLDSFKLWGEQVFGWYYYVDKTVYEPSHKHGVPGGYVRKRIKKRLTNKQYLVLGRGGAKSLYDTCIHAYYLTIYPPTTHQICTSPTMRQSDEVMSPFRTAIARKPGVIFKFMTEGSLNNTTGSRMNRPKLFPSKKGIENTLTNSLLEVRPMTIDKLQGLRPTISTVDEWLSGDIREDVVGALEQGAAKNDDWLIILTSSEGTVRNSVGDTIKMELMSILKGEYNNPHCSIWHYRLDDVKEVAKPEMWIKANPNLGKTVSYETYQQEVERAEHSPTSRNDTLAKRFGIPTEGYTYFFTYEETIPYKKIDFWGCPCALGADLSQGDDFCAFTFLFPLRNGKFGVKTRSYISEATMRNLQSAMRLKYDEFIAEGSLIVLPEITIDLEEVYEDLDKHIAEREYDVCCFGYDPYHAKEFVNRWITDNGDFGIEKVPQGFRTESVPLGDLKHLSEDKRLIFDEKLMQFAMENCITLEDTNGNRKLWKQRRKDKIDNVAALMDAYVAYNLNKDVF